MKELDDESVARFVDKACSGGLVRCQMHLTDRRTVIVAFSIYTAPIVNRTGAFPNELPRDLVLLFASTEPTLEFLIGVPRQFRIHTDLEQEVDVGEVQALRSG